MAIAIVTYPAGMPRRPRNIAAERDRNLELEETGYGRCGVCFTPLPKPPPHRGGGRRPRETCGAACRQHRRRHPQDFDRTVTYGNRRYTL